MTKLRTGRKPTYDREQVMVAMLTHVESGGTIRSFCKQPGHPSWSLVYSWIRDDESLTARIARAKDIGHDALAEKCLEIAETRSDHPDDVQHRKLQIWTITQLLAKWNPKKYGDRVDLDHRLSLTVVTGVPEKP